MGEDCGGKLVVKSSDASLEAPKEIKKLSNMAGRKKMSYVCTAAVKEKMNVDEGAAALPISRYEDGKMQESLGWQRLNERKWL